MKSLALTVLFCVAVIVCFGIVPTRAANPVANRDVNDISHFVKFETGGTWLRDGDKITIDEIHGTSDKIETGQLYEIKGTYTLKSHDNATLCAYTTSNDPRHFPDMKPQSMKVTKGDGHFTIYFYTWCDGNAHLSFYPANGGESFASVYFGTGDNVLKHAGWLDGPKP